MMIVRDTARGAYEAVAGYERTLGATPVAWADLSPALQSNAIDQAIHILGNPDATPQTVHEAWMRTKLEAGWVYGDAFNATSNPPTSPSLVPWDKLPPDKQVRSRIFLAVVAGFAAAAYRVPTDVQAELDKQQADREAAAAGPRPAKLGDIVLVNTPGRPISDRTQHAGMVTDPGDGTTISAAYFPANNIIGQLSSLPAERTIDRAASPNAQSWQFP